MLIFDMFVIFVMLLIEEEDVDGKLEEEEAAGDTEEEVAWLSVYCIFMVLSANTIEIRERRKHIEIFFIYYLKLTILMIN